MTWMEGQLHAQLAARRIDAVEPELFGQQEGVFDLVVERRELQSRLQRFSGRSAGGSKQLQ